jgi:hypothetical protein
MSEHRVAARHGTLRTGIIEFESGTGNIISVPCTIRDVSASGARLELNNSLGFSKQFSLIFNDELRKACRVAWRRGRLIGSAFADGPASEREQAVMMTADEQARHRQRIGARVRNARKARGYAEVELAERIGVPCEFVLLAEKGEANIPLYQLMRIADLLLVNLDRLVAGPAPSGFSRNADAA